MNFLMSQLLTFVFIGLAVAAVLKLFRLSTDLSEIKDILTDFKRSSIGGLAPQVEHAVASPADLVRAVNAEGMDEADAYAKSLLNPPSS
jgi:hypothetical protein